MRLRDQKVSEFLETVSSKSPAPGGGSVSALAGALGASLATMVGNLTIGKKRYQKLSKSYQRDIDEAFENMQVISKNIENLIDEDKEAFDNVMTAIKMPKETEEEKEKRKQELEKATYRAMEVPLQIARESLKALNGMKPFVLYGNPNAITDIGVGASMARTAIDGAIYNVRINLMDIEDESFVKETMAELTFISQESDEMLKEIKSFVENKLTN
ncbi:cyclodeaminase/cyclohydrolase family protein [Natranaerobius trueperi]|uniref:Formimidoyltetrahydrofolate cyclodeaminase n=1 Tax=Natranaerobius trueperi TaxID=759412 RepID=A0A226BVX0_9FIRM|nr:cyclodeaminase/cyclohydrolase family protein [Natranaerobius trueperi]OWZ83146.1 formimidoyltetrahydrofolate cyclodeaminase [Natranaerobius trueperi]